MVLGNLWAVWLELGKNRKCWSLSGYWWWFGRWEGERELPSTLFILPTLLLALCPQEHGFFLWPSSASLLEPALPSAYISWQLSWLVSLGAEQKGHLWEEQMRTEGHGPWHGVVLCQTRVRAICTPARARRWQRQAECTPWVPLESNQPGNFHKH